MRINHFSWLCAFVLYTACALAYIDCTPESCESGYTDNGIVCDGSECYRNCTIEICNGDWTEVYSDPVGFDKNYDSHESDESGSYLAYQGACYNYSFIAPPEVTYINMNVFETSPDCDSEAIGGFFDDTNTDHSAPWFSGISTRYIGNVGDAEYGRPDVDFLYEEIRAHAESSDDSTYQNDAKQNAHLICTPNSQACNVISDPQCGTSCYGHYTDLYIQQGYYRDMGNPDLTLYDENKCNNSKVGINKLDGYQFKVYSATLSNISEQVTCDRIHEAPNASNVKVIPVIPSAGDDLFCNYTYIDPEELTEQNSSFEWWKNGANQNINSQILSKENLTPGDSWYCKVSPFDGMLLGTKIQSSNTITVRNSTKNTVLYIQNGAIWNDQNYFSDEVNIQDFNQELQNELNNCNEDAAGYCNISLTFSSDNRGLINLSEIEIYYTGSQGITNSLTIESLTNVSTVGTITIFEFIIVNDGGSAITNINWNLDTGNGYIINSSQNISSLAAGKKARVYARFNYSEEGYYNVIANATGIQASAYKTLSFGSTNESFIDVNSLELLSQNSSLAVFGFNINSTAAQTLNDINWSIDTGNGVTSANSLISISPNKTLFVFARHNYTQKGLFTAIASATDGTYQDSESLSIKVKDIEVSGLTLLNISNKNAIFEFVIGNNLAINLTNATWQFNTRDNQIINSSSGMILQQNKEAFVYVRHNFSQSGTFNVNATAINGNLTDSVNLSVVLD